MFHVKQIGVQLKNPAKNQPTVPRGHPRKNPKMGAISVWARIESSQKIVDFLPPNPGSFPPIHSFVISPDEAALPVAKPLPCKRLAHFTLAAPQVLSTVLRGSPQRKSLSSNRAFLYS
jgi:hypothetical protein